LIDASILIEHERGRLDLAQHLAHRQQEEFFLSVVTASELLHGVYRAVQPKVRAKRSACVEAILERFPLLPVDLATARAHAQLWAELAAVGKMIGPHDLWLAATCLGHDLTMVTANLREFAGFQDWQSSCGEALSSMPSGVEQSSQRTDCEEVVLYGLLHATVSSHPFFTRTVR
jgi:predicted nucleic acid-binding protein